MKLLTVSNAKTQKGEAKGYLTGILYLAPHTLATKKSLCPYSTAGCRAACLYTAGRGRFTRTQEARIRKTHWFLIDREGFMDTLYWDIAALRRKAKREGKKLAIRLNGTSDIRWEQIPMGLVDHARISSSWPSIMHCFPDVQFYDYTKYPRILRTLLPDNYDLTYSYAETDTNQQEAARWLEHGHKVAVVYKHKPQTGMYTKIHGVQAVVRDGDETDLTFLHKGACVLALKAKGDAKHDTSGFVLREWSAQLINIR
jgi:hypothetical protein